MDSKKYNRKDVIAFRKTKEKFGGFSNMAGGFPLLVNGISIRSSEALYQACRFPNFPEIQQSIFDQRSPMYAKMVTRPHLDKTRADWNSVRVQIMLWSVHVKLVQNWDSFGNLLLSTEEKEIVEDSSTDNFWGAVPINGEVLEGENVLGCILMVFRNILRKDPDSLKIVKPLPIKDFLILGNPIQSVSKEDKVFIL